MTSFRDTSIKTKLSLIMMLTASASLLFAVVAFAAYDISHVREKAVEEVRNIAQVLGAATYGAVVIQDAEQVNDLVTPILRAGSRRVRYAAIVDNSGRLLAKYGVPFSGGCAYCSVRLPPNIDEAHQFASDHLEFIKRLQLKAGYVYLQYDARELRDHMIGYGKIAAVVFVASLLVAFLLSATLQRIISRPILHLASVERKVTENRNFSIRAVKVAEDELGSLIDGFNEMLDEIEQRDAELRVTTAKAEEANQTKSTFLANMSHELRTPLNAIIGYSEMLLEDAEPATIESLKEDLTKIHKAGKHLLALINDILDISKIEAGRMEVHVENFAVGSLLRDVTTTIAPLVAKNRNELSVNAGQVETLSMQSDVMKVRQILLNLLSNSAKFTQDGKITLDLEIVEDAGAPWLIVGVRDTGIGMTAEQMSTLFRAFAQADTSTSRKFGGTGLGLAITKSYCELLGGSIAVSSELGIGTVFNLHLPMNIVEQRVSVARVDSRRKPGPLVSASAERLVLVIDDDASTRDLMQRVLNRHKFRVVTASDGEAGLQMARELRPDAITLDVLLPGMSGWSVLSALKADPAVSDIPVVMLTMVDDRSRGVALGASDYIIKPIDAANLAHVLRRFESPAGASTALIIDDDDAYRAVVRRMIDRSGWTVIEAENGRVGLRRVAEARPSLILLDLMMPEMDGYAFLREFRKTAAWAAIPIVVVTSKELTSADRASLSGYVSRVLEKSAYGRDELELEIAAILQGYVGPFINRRPERGGNEQDLVG